MSVFTPVSVEEAARLLRPTTWATSSIFRTSRRAWRTRIFRDHHARALCAHDLRKIPACRSGLLPGPDVSFALKPGWRCAAPVLQTIAPCWDASWKTSRAGGPSTAMTSHTKTSRLPGRGCFACRTPSEGARFYRAHGQLARAFVVAQYATALVPHLCASENQAIAAGAFVSSRF